MIIIKINMISYLNTCLSSEKIFDTLKFRLSKTFNVELYLACEKLISSLNF